MQFTLPLALMVSFGSSTPFLRRCAISSSWQTRTLAQTDPPNVWYKPRLKDACKKGTLSSLQIETIVYASLFKRNLALLFSAVSKRVNPPSGMRIRGSTNSLTTAPGAASSWVTEQGRGKGGK